MMHARRAKHKDGNSSVVSYTTDDKGKKNKSIATVWNGWLLTVGFILTIFYLTLPRLKAGMMATKTQSKMHDDGSAVVINTLMEEPEDTEETSEIAPIVTTVENLELDSTSIHVVPECESAPWKPDEDMVGTCPGIRVKDHSIDNMIDCAKTCCADPDCIIWQFRKDKGCLQGKDVRIGQEKDGPAAYCSDHPPFRWKGQIIKNRKDTECSTETWHPDEQPGQCFGLGDMRKDIYSVEDCMKTCCENESCGAWQWQEELGCFYNAHMHSCQKSDDPIVFEPYVGRRKKLSTRTYTDKRNKPAVNWKKKSNGST